MIFFKFIDEKNGGGIWKIELKDIILYCKN